MGNSGSAEYDISFERKIATEPKGQYRCPVPTNTMRRTVKQAVFQAERKLGHPVYINDVFREYVQISYLPIKLIDLVVISLEDLYYNDEMLSDEHFHKYSLNPDMQHSDANPTGFRLYSDYFTIKYPQCILDKVTGILHPKPDTP